MKKIIFAAALVCFVGTGCASAPAEKQATVKQKTDAEIVGTSNFKHQKFGFSFEVPSNFPVDVSVVYAKNGNDVMFIDKKSGDRRLTLIVQPGIPGVPLPENKIEHPVVDGVNCNLYHDVDQADGGKLDKMVCDFPDGGNSVYVGSGELPDMPMVDLKKIAATWKWKK